MTEELNFYQKIAEIQQTLKVKKTQWNEFGKYWYRNAESILITVKPILKANNLMMKIMDEMVSIGERHYLKATITLTDISDLSLAFDSTGFARECSSKPKMSEEQATGSASTFAHKYALQNMFLLDDSVDDPDSKDNTKPAQQPPKKITTTQINQINDIIPKIVGDNPDAQAEKVVKIQTNFSIKTLADLHQDQFNTLIDGLSKQANG